MTNVSVNKRATCGKEDNENGFKQKAKLRHDQGDRLLLSNDEKLIRYRVVLQVNVRYVVLYNSIFERYLVTNIKACTKLSYSSSLYEEI